MPNAYGVYEKGQVYKFETTQDGDGRYSFNFWNITGAEIKVNGTVVEFDPNGAVVRDGASIVIFNVIGGSVDEPAE